jgi:hypothetical protein
LGEALAQFFLRNNGSDASCFNELALSHSLLAVSVDGETKPCLLAQMPRNERRKWGGEEEEEEEEEKRGERIRRERESNTSGHTHTLLGTFLTGTPRNSLSADLHL